MTGWPQDLRYALRQLRRAPGFACVAVLTLALGIGVNVATFSFVDELWLHPMPVRDAHRLVRVFTSNPSSRGEIDRGYSSYPDFLDLRRNVKTLAGVAALDNRGAQVDDGVQTRLVSAAVVSENFFDLLEATPALGRMFTESEFQNSQAPCVVLSYPFWRRQFNGDPALPGRTIIVDSQPVTVLGVLPRGFRGTDTQSVPDLWLPMPTWQQLTGDRQKQTIRRSRQYELFGRLRPDVSLPQAKAELQTLAAGLARAYPESNTGRRMTIVEESRTREGVTNSSLALLGVAGLVLLIACINVAGLLIARGEYRRKEIAARIALGAPRGAIIRQLLAETAVLAALAAFAALVLAAFVLNQLPNLLPQTSIPLGLDAHLNARAMAFAMATALASLLLVGLVPVAQATKVAPAAILKQSGMQASPGRHIWRNSLIVTQVALSLVMVVCTGLLARSVIKALALDPGFNAHQNMLVMELVPAFGTKSDHDSQAFVRAARERLLALPGVTATTTAMRFPFGMSGGGATRKVFLPGSLAKAGGEGVTINVDSIGEGYFSTMGTNLLRGRAISQHDLDAGALVMVVNQSAARRFWPDEDPVGKRLRLGRADGEQYEVVGVAEDGKYNDLREVQMPYLFLPMNADEYGELAMAVRTSLDPEALAPLVRSTLREINREVPIVSLMTLREHMRQALYEDRVLTSLIAVMGGLGLLLAGVGIYGLMAFLVGRRTPEIGVRMALGAPRGKVFRLVIAHALRLTAIGAAIGVAGAMAAAQGLRSLLFGVGPADMFTIAIAVAVLATVALVAAVVPALSAAKVDPMVALRYE